MNVFNWEHFKAILWLRWRLTRNHWQRSGKINAILTLILFVSCVAVSLASFFLTLALGLLLLSNATPFHLLLISDIAIGIFIFGWLVSLLTEIQRTEMLSLEKLLHLPLRFQTAFVLNYLTSWLALPVLCFLPAALGFSLAAIYSHGILMLLVVPLLFSFVFMMTAITYQLQSWVASLINNKRRQRSVITLFTLGFILLTQIPNAIMQFSIHSPKPTASAKQSELSKLNDALAKGEVNPEAYNAESEAINLKYKQIETEQKEKDNAYRKAILIRCNQVLPIGWLAYGASTLAERNPWPALLALLGMSGIGVASMWRAYRTAIRAYTGQNDGGAAAGHRKAKLSSKKLFVARRIPCVDEQASSIATANMVSMMRAPETKLILVGPMILGILFLVMILTNKIPKLPTGTEPFLSAIGQAVLLFFFLTLTMNAFGTDRSGFRGYVLMPMPRRQLLLGKNLATLPIYIAMTIGILVATNVVAFAGVTNVLAAILQSITMFFCACIIGNWTSILFPMPIAAGTGKPLQVDYKSVLAQLLAMFLCPLTAVPAALSIAADFALMRYFHFAWISIFLIVSIVEVFIAWWIYNKMLDAQGEVLQKRETQILELMKLNVE